MRVDLVCLLHVRLAWQIVLAAATMGGSEVEARFWSRVVPLRQPTLEMFAVLHLMIRS